MNVDDATDPSSIILPHAEIKLLFIVTCYDTKSYFHS